MPRGSKPGERRGGRQKGTPNKATRDIRQAILNVYERMGGEDALLVWATANTDTFYTAFLTKMVPRPVEVGGPEGGPVEVIIRSAGSLE